MGIGADKCGICGGPLDAIEDEPGCSSCVAQRLPSPEPDVSTWSLDSTPWRTPEVDPDVHEAATIRVPKASAGPEADSQSTRARPREACGNDATAALPLALRGFREGADGGSFGDYEIRQELGRGGMGVVYLALQISLNRLVALKVIKAGLMADASELERFKNEAEAVARLDHPGIVPVYEVGEHEGQRYFSMKLVDGSNLAEQIASYRDDPCATAVLMIGIAGAVEHAHSRGILHRDLKPANLLLDKQRRPLITDFGLARRLGDDSGLTQSGAILGTPSYMAPEQAAGNFAVVGPTADVYSLGAILYELLTGMPPFRASTVMETLVSVLEREPTRPSILQKDVSPELEAICLKCLEKDPKDRYPTAAALVADLENFRLGEAVAAMRAGPRLRLRRWTRREPQLVARLLGLSAVELLTQVNYYLAGARADGAHFQVSFSIAAWATTSVILQRFERSGWSRESGRFAWAAMDVGFLTLILWQLDAINSPMIVGFPVVVATSGLWFRVSLVWLTTALAEVGYALLFLEGSLREPSGPNNYPNIVMASIAITGFVVARLVKRLLVLTSYYENRLPN